MASDAAKIRKDLISRGYLVKEPTGRGRSSYEIIDPKNGQMIARMPISPSTGSWYRNLLSAIKRYERTGVTARSSRLGIA
jgi:hypothetical protein